jgi:hypothetical protein
MSKMTSHEPFGHLHPKLWAKERQGVKLGIWLPTTKSRESTLSRCVQVECNTPLESSGGELQLCFRPHPNRRSEPGDMSSQSLGSPNRDNFGTPPWESWEKVSFRCSLHERTQRILYGGRWWLPSSPGRGESSESKLPVGCPNTKGVLECELTNLWLVLDAGPCNKIIVPLPSLIRGTFSTPLSPPLMLEVGSGTKFQLLPHFHILGPSSGSNKELGSASGKVVVSPKSKPCWVL